MQLASAFLKKCVLEVFTNWRKHGDSDVANSLMKHNETTGMLLGNKLKACK